MKVITLCGSTRFEELFHKKNRELTLKGYLVFSCGVFRGRNNKEIFEIQHSKALLDQIHRQKIEKSDSIYVINKDGYIGESTSSEIEFAKRHNKEIIYMEKNT